MNTSKQSLSEILFFKILLMSLITIFLSVATCFAEGTEKPTNDEKSSLIFKVYCNSVQGTLLEVEFEELATSEKVEVIIYDMTGKLLYNSIFVNSADEKTQEIDLESKINSGGVFFRAKSSENSVSKKISLRN